MGRRVAWWVLVGALVGLGIAGLLTIGILLLGAALVLAAIGSSTPRLRNRSALGLVGGLAAAPLGIAWLNRGGPGSVCTVSAGTTSCLDAWSPWPFVAVGSALVVGCGVLVHRAQGERQDH
ncbi:hypothetical protein ACPPVS_05390 [Cellulomonas sp. McL0617]|uniref:hypothetical protein n=1 Tax=Cellulomonas sp. McL0617 TaxID=3415675 RepID=UPI003CF9EEF6